MPFIHFYACANPIECPKSDRQLLRFRLARKYRNENAKYDMASSYIGSHFNTNINFYLW